MIRWFEREKEKKKGECNLYFLSRTGPKEAIDANNYVDKSLFLSIATKFGKEGGAFANARRLPRIAV